MGLVGVVAGIQHAVHGGVVFVNLGVLGVEVEDCAAQGLDHRHRVHPLPDQMTGVQVGSDFRSHSLPQLQQRMGVVHAEAGVQLQGDFIHAVGLGKCGKVLPVGDQYLVPLPFQNFGVILRPGAGHPVGILGPLVVSGAAGKGVYLVDAQLFRQQDSVAHHTVVLFGKLLVGVDRVPVAGEGADFHAVFLNQTHEFIPLFLTVQQNLRVAVGAAGVVPAANLHHLDSQGLKVFQRILQGEVGKQSSKYT